MKKLSHRELIDKQTEQGIIKIPLIIVVNNIRSLYNVGSIFRTADGVGVKKVWLCGITGVPPSSKISKTALDAEQVVAWEYRESAADLIQELKTDGYEIVSLEQTAQSMPYHEYKPSKPVCLILGNEVTGVGDDLLPHCDQALEIEMSGIKNSLNVTVAFGIVAYQLRQNLLSLR